MASLLRLIATATIAASVLSACGGRPSPARRRARTRSRPQHSPQTSSRRSRSSAICSRGESEPYYRKLLAATGKAALYYDSIFKADGTHVFLVGPPITREAYEKQEPNANAIGAIYADIAEADPAHVTYVDAGAAVEGPNASYAQTLPCLVVEPCTGPVVERAPSNVVRSPDGVHFCPDESGDENGEVNGCTLYSSGAYRYANAMLEALETPTARSS